jgi:hypothetical protein
MREAGLGQALRDGLLQRGHRQLRGQASAQCPAHHLARERIRHYGQVDELSPQANISDVGYP